MKKKRKTIPFWWAELFVLIMIGILFLSTFQMEKSRYEMQVTEYNNDMWDAALPLDNDYWRVSDMTKPMLDEYLHHVMSYIPMSSGKSSHMTSNASFAAEFYDIDGNVIVSSSMRNLHVIYYDPIGGKTKWFNLDDYFSEDAVDTFVEHCFHSDGLVSVSYIDGYRAADGAFIPVKIQYQLNNAAEENLLFSMESETADAPKYEANPERIDGEDAGVRLQLYNEDPSQNENAFEALREQYELDKNNLPELVSGVFAKDGAASMNGGEYVMMVGGSGVYGIIVMSFPLYKMTICSVAFWQRFIFLSAVIQIGMLIIYILYREMMEKQQELDHMRSTFINAMAHEMKTPAAVIKNGTECIKEGIHPEKNDHYLDMISYEADHLNDLLSKMLVYTRTSEGVYQLHKEAVSLMDMVKIVCQSYQLAIEFKGIQMEIQEDNPQELSGDAVLLKMVVDNFISNAVKYGAENGKIVITVKEKGLLVYNQGKPLTSDEQTRIWEPLYMGDESRTEIAGSSSGMGLAICKNILELHNAKYGVENTDGGVRFFFTLP